MFFSRLGFHKSIIIFLLINNNVKKHQIKTLRFLIYFFFVAKAKTKHTNTHIFICIYLYQKLCCSEHLKITCKHWTQQEQENILFFYIEFFCFAIKQENIKNCTYLILYTPNSFLYISTMTLTELLPWDILRIHMMEALVSYFNS